MRNRFGWPARSRRHSPGANALTISGNNIVRVFNMGMIVGGGVFGVALSGLTTTNGLRSSAPFAAQGGGIFNVSSGVIAISNCAITGNTATAAGLVGGVAEGGAIYSGSGTLAMTNCTISGNTATSASGTLSEAHGGAIFNEETGKLSLNNCTISGNTAISLSSFSLAHGAGVVNNGSATIANCTISGNTADAGSTNGSAGGGGGILNGVLGTLAITNCTISDNIASGTSAGGGGIFNTAMGTVNARNSLIALNASGSGPDLSGSFTSQGHNLIGKSDGSMGFSNGLNNDQVGSMASPLDPKLGPLQNNGGPTLTGALLMGGPAIDAGDDSVLGSPLFLITDQRGPGFPRRSGLHADIGAFELQVFFDTCLKDNSTGNLFQFNSVTGQYVFTRCSDGFAFGGTGMVRLVNGILTLTDSKPDRRVSAGCYTGQRTGSVIIYVMIGQGIWQTFRISDTNPSAMCAC
jgi:hypothetical protein